MSSRDAWTRGGRSALVLDVDKSTSKEQLALWRKQLPTLDIDFSKRLAGYFHLSVSAIKRVTKTVQQEESKEGQMSHQVWEACLVETRPQLDALAQRIIPKATWDDIVLPKPQMTLLQKIASQGTQQGYVYDEWGWRRKMNRGLGMTVLFSGESGTGKTISIHV